MKRRILSAAIAILCLSAAASAQTRTLRVAGVNRNYILHAPSGLEKPPLVFVIHGFNMTGQQEVSLTRMNQVADREKFTLEGGGHEWPMNTQTKVNNSEEVWAFFKKHSLASPTAIHRREGRTSAGTIRAESAGGRIRLRGAGAESTARVLDTRGRVLATDITDGYQTEGR